MTEIGEIPEEWFCVKIGYPKVTRKMKAGGTPLKSIDNYYKNGKIPFVKIEDIVNSSKYLTRTLEFITDDGLNNSSTWLIPKNSILFSMYASYGEVCINQIPVATNQAIISIVPNKESVDVNFLYYELKNLKNSLKQYLRSTTQKNLNAEIVKGLKIVLPPLPEQQKIAEILSSMDKAIQRLNDQITQTGRIKKGLKQNLLTKGIGHSMFKATRIGKIPEEWNIKKLNDISTKITDGTHITPHYLDFGIPFLRITDIQSEKIDWDRVKRISLEEHKYLSKHCLPEENDILLSKNGTIGITKLVDWKIRTSIFVSLCLIKPDPKEVNSYFLSEYISSKGMEQIFLRLKKLTVTNLHLIEIRNLMIPIPPIEEQMEISKILKSINEFELSLRNYRSKLNDLQLGLVQDLLTGKVRVNNLKGVINFNGNTV